MTQVYQVVEGSAPRKVATLPFMPRRSNTARILSVIAQQVGVPASTLIIKPA